jgi:hypothetical protein
MLNDLFFNYNSLSWEFVFVLMVVWPCWGKFQFILLRQKHEPRRILYVLCSSSTRFDIEDSSVLFTR